MIKYPKFFIYAAPIQPTLSKGSIHKYSQAVQLRNISIELQILNHISFNRSYFLFPYSQELMEDWHRTEFLFKRGRWWPKAKFKKKTSAMNAVIGMLSSDFIDW